MARRKQDGAASSRKKLKFEHRLVLVNWMLDLFGESSFDGIARNMRDPAFEGFGEDGISKFHQCLKLLFDRPELPHDMLLAYDENIVRHWKAITTKRNADGQVLYPKYFQYLCLPFHRDLPRPVVPRPRETPSRPERLLRSVQRR